MLPQLMFEVVLLLAFVWGLLVYADSVWWCQFALLDCVNVVMLGLLQVAWLLELGLVVAALVVVDELSFVWQT